MCPISEYEYRKYYIGKLGTGCSNYIYCYADNRNSYSVRKETNNEENHEPN